MKVKFLYVIILLSAGLNTRAQIKKGGLNADSSRYLPREKAQFLIAFHHTMGFEGGYANDKDDRGGETFMGISRKNFPKWPGWKIVDSTKTKSNFKNLLMKDSVLVAMVQVFYKSEFWDKMHGSEIEGQDFANQFFDACVNTGLRAGIKLFQEMMGIKITGKMDSLTLCYLRK